jgi:hypothetical protein
MVASLFVIAAPVAADTTGGSGTTFTSSSITCSPGTRTTCTETEVQTFTDSSGTFVCLVIVDSAQGAHGRPVVHYTQGCTNAATVTIGGDNSVTLASTTISLATCDHRRCVHPTNYTVSASDTPSGDPTTTVTVSTSTTGTCTTVTTYTDVSTPLSGTMIVNGVTIAEDGFLDTFTQDSSSTGTC